MTRPPMTRRAGLRAAMALAATWALGGCASQFASNFYYGENTGGPRPGAQPLPLIEANHRAVDQLLMDAAWQGKLPVLVATLVNVDRLHESSRLGRMFSEQIAGRLVQRGVPVTEVRMRESLLIERTQGELLLSRELRELSRTHNAQAVVVGTYAASAHTLFISLKWVQPEGNVVLAAHNYAVPMDDDVRTLLAHH